MNRRDFIEKSFLASFGAVVLSACTTSEKKESPKQTQEIEPTSAAPVEQKTAPDTDEKTDSAATPSAKDASVQYVDVNSTMAKNLKYVEDAKNADPSLRVKRGDTEGKDQLCSNCSFYTAEPNKDYGKCTLLPDGFVTAAGWCNTWAKKVKAS